MEHSWKRNSLSWSQRFEGFFKYKLASGEEIAIKQSPENEPPQCVYDAAIILAEYIRLTHLPKILEAKKPYNILELGSGCGFSSIYLKKHSDKNVNYVVTDVPNVCNLIQQNIYSNFENVENIASKPLFWGK